jgi:3-oxoacyl-[acyl-carrier-protein] synthase-3
MNAGKSPYLFPEYRPRYLRRHCRILATGSYLPDRVVTNQEIIEAGTLPVTDLVIRKTLGVEQRRVAAPGVTDSDLLAEAARRCLERAGVHPDRLTKILVTKFLGDRILPMTAALVQRKLHCRVTMHAVDLEGGITAFLHAVDLATRYISTSADDEQLVLVLSGGLQTLAVSKTDPRLAFLFGDGAAALLLAVSPQQHVVASYSYTNHEYFDAAGTRPLRMEREIAERIYEQGEYRLLEDLYQMGNWKEVAPFYLEAAEVTRDRLLEESGLSMKEMDLVLVTENNARLRQLTLERLGVPEEKSLSLIREYGNTMSAMLPLLLDAAFARGRLREGMHVMLISHGEGASGGGLIYRV